MRAWLLALVLLAAQSAGLAHRVNHAAQPGSGTSTAAAQQIKRSAIDHLAGSADCKLFDQLTHADALCAGLTAKVPAVLPTAVADPLPVPLLLAGPATLYLARAPPGG